MVEGMFYWMRVNLFVFCFVAIVSDAFAIRLEYEEGIPQIQFGVDELHQATEVVEIEADSKRITLKIDPSLSKGYLIRSADGQVEAWGADARETMYAALDLAESIRLGKDIFLEGDKRREPYIDRRGIKFNIPLDARTPSYDDTGDAAQKNIVEMWSMDFWVAYLDQLARDRYNVLTLWNPHPFPSMIELEAYPDVALDDVCVTTAVPNGRENEWGEPQLVSETVVANLKVVKRIPIADKIQFWRAVMKHAKDRGIDVYVITWNIALNSVANAVPDYYRTYATSVPNEKPGKYGISHDVLNPKTIRYLRDAVKTFILTYPDLKGIGVTAGEHFPPGDHYDREEWLWESYGLGILDAKSAQPKRTVEFIHRFWNTGFENIMKYWGQYPDSFTFSFKYARARLYSSPKIPFADEHVADMKPRGMKSWWNLRNDDIFVHRWGDPDYVRDFFKNMDLEATAGYYMGSDGYVWGREFVSRNPELHGELEINKHWFAHMLWGRLGYDPELDADYFKARLAERFPGVDAAHLLSTWQAASKIIPLINRYYWRNWDHMWSVENCMSHYDGFQDVLQFTRNETMQGSGLVNIRDYVRDTLAGKQLSGDGPMQVADQLEALCETTLVEADKIATMSANLTATVDDMRGMAWLGLYYAHKFRSAASLALYQETNDKSHQLAAVAQMEEGYDACTRYADHSQARYHTQMLARPGRLDWSALLQFVRSELAYLKKLP